MSGGCSDSTWSMSTANMDQKSSLCSTSRSLNQAKACNVKLSVSAGRERRGKFWSYRGLRDSYWGTPIKGLLVSDSALWFSRVNTNIRILLLKRFPLKWAIFTLLSLVVCLFIVFVFWIHRGNIKSLTNSTCKTLLFFVLSWPGKYLINRSSHLKGFIHLSH